LDVLIVDESFNNIQALFFLPVHWTHGWS